MKRLKELRRWSGHTQLSLSRDSGVLHSRIVKAELGALELARDEWEKIEKAIKAAHSKQAARIQRWCGPIEIAAPAAN